MITSNKLKKLNSQADVELITSDDIPEGDYHKYCLDYAEGKLIGDIVLRSSPEEVPCHSLLNGQKIYQYDHKAFYKYCDSAKTLAASDEKYEFFNKTNTQYEEFLNANTWQQTGQKYCPYFVLDKDNIEVYTVTKDEQTGYTNVKGEQDIEMDSGLVYKDVNLTEVLDFYTGWYYTGAKQTSSCNYVKLPTYPTYLNGNVKAYTFIITESRVENDTTSIRSVTVGVTHKLKADDQPFVHNVGTLQNLVLDFGVPSGTSGTIEVGNVTEGEYPLVTNVGTKDAAIFDFVLPRGKQGAAGGTVYLKGIGSKLPETAEVNDKFYLSTDNTVYIWNGSKWETHLVADEGMLYLDKGNIYYYRDNVLVPTSIKAKADKITTIINDQGAVEVIGRRNKQGTINYDWIGTLEDWRKGRQDGSILDSYICYVTND